MDRKIKFRAWDNFNDTMWKQKDSIGVFFTNMEELIKAGNNVTLMRYSGVNTKDGEEIYEDDILYYKLPDTDGDDESEHADRVMFLDGCFCVDGYIPVSVLADWDCKIVGNIHQNPELLKT